MDGPANPRVRPIARLVGALTSVWLLGAMPAFAVPIVSPENIVVDDSAATGPGGKFRIADSVVISWDNSAAGDDNPTVTETSQVVFDVFGIVSLEAATVSDSVFSVTYVFGFGDGNLADVAATVTVTDAQGTTGPVSGLETFDVATIPPRVTVANISIDYTDASGPNDVFRPGDTVVVNWDNSATGDDNPDVTQVEFDLSNLGGSSNQMGSVSNDIYTASYTFPPGGLAFTDAPVSVTAENDAGTSGSVDSLQTVDFDPNPPPVPGLAPWAAIVALVMAGFLVSARGTKGPACARS